MISIKGLHKFFNKGRQNEIHVINDVNLDLPEKGIVAIFGKSGCGKTTLLNVIGGLDGFAQGSVTVEYQNIRDNTDDIRNQYIGYIFQNYNLNKEETCFDNVADALRLCGITNEEQIEERVMAALSNVGMDKYAKRTPDTLSGGQQQRIAIARAIVKNPKIILADEPTGNLDEANTVMIMDLLKAISKDHLVLLVTHEANLVDYYCDTVVELQDGKVINIKQNSSANGFAARDKNDIYLGELTRSDVANENAQIEYYGDKPEKPIKLKIVNNGGKLYVQIETEKVQIIDQFSEVKLRDGVYEEKVNENAVSKEIDMSKLPPISGSHFGRLFSTKSSIKSGYNANFKSRKKGKKFLLACMSLFAAVIVIVSTIFGSAFGDIIDARNSYNHNVFYVYTPDGTVSEKLATAMKNGEAGIDYVRLTPNYPEGDSEVAFRTGTFETFSQSILDGGFTTNAVYLDVSLASSLSLVAGTKDNLANTDMLITTKVADELLEKSTLGYISERKDLIGLVSSNFTVDGKAPRIAGIVDSNESAVYLTELAMAKYVQNYAQTSYTALASDYGFKVTEGEAVLAIKYQRTDAKYPKVGETIKIQGRDIKITAIKQYCGNYIDWLTLNNIEKKDEYQYFIDIVKAENPDLKEDSPEFMYEFDEISRTRRYEFYDYFYSEIDAFIKDLYFFEPDYLELWLYVEKDIDVVKYNYIGEDYYKAVKYKNMYGKYPTDEDLKKEYDNLPNIYDELDELRMAYENEFFNGNSYSNSYVNTYMVSEADYIAFSKQLGETHPSAKAPTGDVVVTDKVETDGQNNFGEKETIEEIAPGDENTQTEFDSKPVLAADPAERYDMDKNVMVDSSYYSYYPYNMYYTVIHSSDPAKTAAFLESEFSSLTTSSEFEKPILTPDTIFNSIIKDKTETIVSSLITIAVIIALMSVCMYFIMRSSLMNRIKEVGIYRAIGVSKKNLVFKFFIESLVLTILTVFIGFLAVSAFIYLALGMSSIVSQLLYYPLWLAIADLVLLFVISVFFGTLPIISLLQKTPSEILAKYDI